MEEQQRTQQLFPEKNGKHPQSLLPLYTATFQENKSNESDLRQLLAVVRPRAVAFESTQAQATQTCPEIELLLCCARTRIDSEKAEQIKALLQEDIDWDYLLRTAFSQGLIPLLYWSLNATCPEAVPKAILDQLRDYLYSLAKRNLFLTGELLKLLNLLKTHGIAAIPFKGPILAASVYGNLALRQFSDLDILVHERDVLRAKNLLISQGYRLQLELGWEDHLVHEDGMINVDLHQAITPTYFSFPLDFERLRSRLEPLSIGGTTVSNLLPEDLLLILCVQWGKDCWEKRSRLAQLCDVAELLRVHPRLDWGQILKQASILGSERMLLLCLCLVSELLGAALPEEVLKRMQADPVAKSLAEHVREQLFRQADDPPGGLEEKTIWSLLWDYHDRFYFKMRERLTDRVTYCLYKLRLAITPNKRDWAFLPLPTFLHFLYYPLRPIRLVRKYGLGPLRRFPEI